MLPFTTLIVDDNTPLRETISELLRNRFPTMAVEQAGSGEEAMEKLQRAAPNLVLMDIHLPGRNGLQLTRSIRSQSIRQPVVVIWSGNDLPEYRAAARSHGAEFFLSKSFSSTQELLSLVESIYSRHREVS